MAEERCEQCGALLTPSEQRVVLEDGGRPLCAVHALEELPDPTGGEPGTPPG